MPLSKLKFFRETNGMFEAVILAGGFGSRLKSVTGPTPKPMVDLNGVPFLYRLLEQLQIFGCTRVVLSLGYESQFFIDRIGVDKPVDIEVDWVVEDRPLGTGGGIRLAAKKINSESFVVLNGDTFLDIDYAEFYRKSIESDLFMSAAKVEDVSRYGTLDLASDHALVKFQEKGTAGPGLINAGAYVLNRFDILSYPEDSFSFEREFLPNYQKRIEVFVMEGFFIDIGIPEDFRKAERYFL